jgi:hypothetical protein
MAEEYRINDLRMLTPSPHWNYWLQHPMERDNLDEKVFKKKEENNLRNKSDGSMFPLTSIPPAA